jgi:hypothetical protein
MAAGFVALRLPPARTHLADFGVILAGSLVWAAVSFGVLYATGSKLPAQVLRRGR